MKTIAVIPCYNEAQHVAKVIEETKQYVDEVIVVDDGSSDTTFEQAKNANRVLKHIINLGKGAAMKTGYYAALQNLADVIIFIDGDGQHKPEDIPRFLKTFHDNALDIVVGQRSYNKEMPGIFKLGNWGLNKIFTIFFGLRIEDTQSGYRAIRADILGKIEWNSTGYAVETEMLANAGTHSLRCMEIPIDTIYLDKTKGTTIFDGLRIGWQMLRWKLRW